MKILVLLSGGIDSAALVGRALSQGHECAALFVDYGQPSYMAEGAAAQAVADHFGVRLYNTYTKVRLGDMATGTDAHVVPARNLLLASLAVNVALVEGYTDVWLGAISEDYLHYEDCRLGFAMQLSKATVMLGISVHFPWVFEQANKQHVVGLARAYGVPLEVTYSCYAKAPACGACPSCKERERVLAK